MYKKKNDPEPNLKKEENKLEEDEILESVPEPVSEPVPEDISVQTDPLPVDSSNDAQSETPVNTGLSETPHDHLDDQKDETLEEISSNDDLIEGENEDQINEGEETDEGGSTTNITIIRPPMQQITYYADEDATYHAVIDNDETDPVPVLVTETLIEKYPGIMTRRLEDYSVTEGLLLLILITLWLRMIFDYSGRRNS